MKSCTLCSSENVTYYINVNGWSINRCFDCGVLYTVVKDKRVKERKNFYGEEYINSYISKEKLLKNRFIKHLVRIEKYKHGGKLLDMGCGVGYFIEVVEHSGKYFWKATGLELNKDLILRAKSDIRLKITRGSFFKLPFKKNSFDCITCFDVLEHDHDLKSNVDKIIAVVKKNGIIVIQVPNYKSLMAYMARDNWDWWAPPDHILHFSFDFLLTLLKEKDLEILEVYTYEPTKDFLLNVKVRFRQNLFTKLIFYLSVPLLIILERMSWLFNLGALSFVIARRK